MKNRSLEEGLYTRGFFFFLSREYHNTQRRRTDAFIAANRANHFQRVIIRFVLRTCARISPNDAWNIGNLAAYLCASSERLHVHARERIISHQRTTAITDAIIRALFCLPTGTQARAYRIIKYNCITAGRLRAYHAVCMYQMIGKSHARGHPSRSRWTI